jgi:hypothetical protein
MSKVNIWTQSDYFLAFARYEYLKTLNSDEMDYLIQLADLGENYQERFDAIVDAWAAGKTFDEDKGVGGLEVRAAHE